MTNKFTIGSQWTTKGGWRAVVVNKNSVGIVVWIENDNDTYIYDCGGMAVYKGESYNLDTPYIEPRKGTVWVNVYLSDDGGIYSVSSLDGPEEYIEGDKLIASFKHDWTENEKL